LRGLHECALRKAIATGQIKAEADNRIDAAKADAMWDASTDPTKLRCTYARGLGRGTAARVRVLIDSTNGDESWTTVGVSENIIEASWQALLDSIVYGLVHTTPPASTPPPTS
jgi:hypothetical protein